MFKPSTNPPSRFEEVHIEWDEEAPPAKLRVYDDDSKSILAKNESPDLLFTWSLNPYRGCSHSCIYCYARSSHEHLGWGAGTDFDSRILVKRNAAALVTAAFDAASWQGEAILFSGNTDCYQPLEHRLGLTRACFEVCLRYRNPVSVITKSNLIERDVELLAELNRVASVRARGRRVKVCLRLRDRPDHGPRPSGGRSACRRRPPGCTLPWCAHRKAVHASFPLLNPMWARSARHDIN